MENEQNKQIQEKKDQRIENQQLNEKINVPNEEDQKESSPAPLEIKDQSQQQQITGQKAKVMLKLPPASFVIALLTVCVTIAAGVALAIFIRNQISQSTNTNSISPLAKPGPTKSISKSSSSESYPSAEDEIQENSFESLFDSEQSPQSTSTSKLATQASELNQ